MNYLKVFVVVVETVRKFLGPDRSRRNSLGCKEGCHLVWDP